MTRKARSIQIVLASAAILSSAVIASAVVPREMMARPADSFDIRKIIPKDFGEWSLQPNIRLVEPEPGSLSRQLYSQEVAYGFKDRDSHVVMLLIAYGPNQSQRLQLHRPELCYAAAGFRVSRGFGSEVFYRDNIAPLKLTRLVAQREARLEPVSYWMRLGNDIATGVIERQLIRIKYGFNGLIPDGALIRVSTVGLPVELAYPLQDRFIRDLLNAVDPKELSFFVGGEQNNAKFAKLSPAQ